MLPLHVQVEGRSRLVNCPASAPLPHDVLFSLTCLSVSSESAVLSVSVPVGDVDDEGSVGGKCLSADDAIHAHHFRLLPSCKARRFAQNSIWVLLPEVFL